MTHICIGKPTIIGSDNGSAPGRRQAIIWTNAGILLIGPLGINFNEMLIEINIFSFKKMHLKLSSAKWRLFRLGLKELIPEALRGQGMKGCVAHCCCTHCILEWGLYSTWPTSQIKRTVLVLMLNVCLLMRWRKIKSFSYNIRGTIYLYDDKITQF